MEFILYLIISISAGYYIYFIASQGGDERGQKILANSSQVAFLIMIIGFVFQVFFFTFMEPTIDQIQILIGVWMASVFLGNDIAIIVNLKTKKLN